MPKNLELAAVVVAILTNPREKLTSRERVCLTRVPTVGEIIVANGDRHVIVLRVAHCSGDGPDCHAEVWVDNFDHTKLGEVWRTGA